MHWKSSIAPQSINLQWLHGDHSTQKFQEKEVATGATRMAEHTEFYTLDISRAHAISKQAEELHQMFMAATAHVLASDERLNKFGYDPALWPLFRASFAARAEFAPIAGRFDVALTHEGIKVYEYNCDSAADLYECGSVQGRWGRVAMLPGSDAGTALFEQLVRAWQESAVAQAGSTLHVMFDDDVEEAYHAGYMQSAAESAGVRCKPICGLAALSWKDGAPVDADGEAIRFVWKAWSWETVFDSMRMPQAAKGTPTLADVLLLQPGVKVWEPLWTCIPSNKAILPVLWDMFPEHPCLLRAEYTISEALRATGYVAKPIVGRCGSNVTIFNPEGKILASSAGHFGNKHMVYQQTCHLPRSVTGGVLLCPWLISGRCAGMVLRVDKGLITMCDSPGAHYSRSTLRLVDSDELLQDHDVSLVTSSHLPSLLSSRGLRSCGLSAYEKIVPCRPGQRVVS